MNEKHTPGPWKLTLNETSRGAFLVASKDGMAIARRDRPTPWAEEGEANARLIAAAPDLLDACKVALALDSLDAFVGNEQVARVLRAAVAKAETA